MCNYSSAKLKLLVLKWSVAEKFHDYLLGFWFQVYTDSNLLTYIQDSKMGASQIQWLSELALFDFTIKYQTGHSNKAGGALSHCPFNPSCNSKNETDSNEVEVISYSSVCEAVDQCINSSEIPEDLEQKAQDSCAVQSIVEEDKEEVVSTVNVVSIFLKVTPEEMKEEQQKDPILKLVYKQVTAGEKHKTSTIAKVKSKTVRKYLLQFNWLTLKKGVLHHLYINNDVEYHQTILPIKYQTQVLCLLHSGQGHQGLEHTLALLGFYWDTMFQDITNYVKNCPHCQTVKDDYVDLKTKLGTIISHNPVDLLCIDFTKVDPSKDGKENSLDRHLYQIYQI